MAGEALREIIASFTVEVDKAGALRKGTADIDAMRERLRKLEAAAQSAATNTAKAFGRLANGQFASKASRGLAAFGSGRPDTNGWFAEGLKARVRAAEGALPMGPQFGPKIPFGARGGGGLFDKLAPGPDGLARLGAFAKSLANVQTALAALGATAAFGALKGIVDTIGGIGERATKLGVATDEFQRLDVLAKQNNTSVEALGTAFRTLAGNAVSPTKEATAAFKQLGVTVRQDDGTFKTRQDLFFETASALADISDETVRADLAQKLYGRSALEMSALLSEGSEGIAKQRAELAKLPVVGASAIKAADGFSDSWEAMKLRLMAVAGPVLEKVVIPAMNALVVVVNTLADAFGKLELDTGLLAAGLVLLGPKLLMLSRTFGALISLGGGFKGMLSGIGGGLKALRYSTGALVAQFLLLEDIFTFFAGGDSLTGRGLDALFGDGVAKGVQKTIGELTAAFKDLWNWVLGDGAGTKASALFTEIGQALRLMVNDALALIPGSGRTAGIEGLNAFDEKERAGDGGLVSTALNGIADIAPFIPIPGVGTALGAGARAAASFTDNRTQSVQINMGTASPAEVAKRVGVELGRDRNAIVAGAP